MSSHDVYRHANKVLVYSLVYFSCGQHENRRCQHGKGEDPCRIFSRQQYLPLLLPGTGNHRSRPSQTPRRNAADKTHAAFFPTPFPENIFFKKAASEALPFPETQSTIRTGPPMRNAAYFVLSQPSGPA